MEIFGIGASELIFILLIAIIVLGPRDMQKAGRTIGRWLNQLIRSDGWKAFQRASKEIRNLPTNLMREANLEELKEMDREIRNSIDPRPHPPASRSDHERYPSRPGPAQPRADPGESELRTPEDSADTPQK